MKKLFSIILPSWNNEQYLTPCVFSIMQTGVLQSGMAELIIINNGKQNCDLAYGHLPNVKVLNPGENLGWEGGLKLGLQHSSAPFVCFQNDDTFIPPTMSRFYEHLIQPFSDPVVSAVGPSTTVAAGVHSIYRDTMPRSLTECPFLIFFTVMIRRSHLDEVGGIDDTLPGGDDIDLSMRFISAGKKVLFNPNAFIIHHAFKTGERVKGGPDVDMGWNSKGMSEATNIALIRKHGFKRFVSTLTYGSYQSYEKSSTSDSEGNFIRSFITQDMKVVELGCGYSKTVPNSIGVDIVPTGEKIPHGAMLPSVADIVADITKPLPFSDSEFDVVIARHILEHCIDPISALKEWKRILKVGGKLIIAVPDQDLVNGIPLDHTHVHAFNRDSLTSLLEVCGLKSLSFIDGGNGISFISVTEIVPEVVNA